jgi:hypothetical protein
MRDYVVRFDPNDLDDPSQPDIIIDQFVNFRDEVRKMIRELPSVFQ